MKKAKRKKSGVWKAIGVVCILLVIVLGVLFYVLHKRTSELSDIQTAEIAKQEQYTTLITSTSAPAGWDEETMGALRTQALEAYDDTFLTTVNAALNGDEDAITEVLNKKESTQPDAVAQYETLFNNLSNYPVSLGKLLISDPGTMSLVLSYSGSSSSADASTTTLTQNLEESVPSLKTFDPAWGFVEYGDGLMATDGSAPTSLSMIFSHIFNDPEMTPLFFAEFAEEYNYAKNPIGSDSSLFAAAAWTYGVNMTPNNATATAVNNSLTNGGLVVLHLGDDSSSKFVVATEINDDGTWTILDPTSSEEVTYINPDDVRDQILGSYSYW